MKLKGKIILGILALLTLSGALIASSREARNFIWVSGAIIGSEIKKPRDKFTVAIRQDPKKEWGSKVDLIPTSLAKGQPRDQVDSALTIAGYAPAAERLFDLQGQHTFPNDAEYYSMSSAEFPCSIRYAIVVQYDAEGKLLEGFGTVNEAGCL